jgi:hypothetical protein
MPETGATHMADQDADDAQAATLAAPQAGGENSRPQAGGQDETISLDEARKLRREAASLRKRIEEHEASKLSETQKLQRQNQELQTQLAALLSERQERATQAQIAAAAGKAGALYPDTLYRLADSADIELDEAGNVRNATALVNKLRQTYPALFRAVSVDGGAGGSVHANDANEINNLIRRAAGRG